MACSRNTFGFCASLYVRLKALFQLIVMKRDLDWRQQATLIIINSSAPEIPGNTECEAYTFLMKPLCHDCIHFQNATTEHLKELMCLISVSSKQAFPPG